MMGWKIYLQYYAGMNKKCSENGIRIQNFPGDLEKWSKMTILSRKRFFHFYLEIFFDYYLEKGCDTTLSGGNCGNQAEDINNMSTAWG